MNKISMIGLGFFGFPIARILATKYEVISFDINKARITEPNSYHSNTLGVEYNILKAVLTGISNMQKPLFCSNNLEDFKIFLR